MLQGVHQNEGNVEPATACQKRGKEYCARNRENESIKAAGGEAEAEKDP